MQFEFATAAQIIFGSGKAKVSAAAARSMGSRPLVVCGGSARHVTLFGDDAKIFSNSGEPTIDAVRRGLALAREHGCDVIVAIGGGSVIDLGKAIASLLTNSGDPLDYLEVVGKGQPITQPSLPFIAIPTTSGAGAEVTRNAVLGSPEHGVKASLRSPYLLPRLAIVDPELTYDLPAALTASTGMDALTQLIEPFVSIRANAMADLCCVDGMFRAATSLVTAVESPSNDARAQMSMAALLGGMALANAGLGIVHGFAAPIGGSFAAPHGAVCAALLPFAMEVNVRALRSRQPDSPILHRYDEVARILTGYPHAAADDGIRWLGELSRRIGIPALRTYQIGEQHVPALVEKAAKASSTKGNSIELTSDELTEILSRAL